MQIESSKKVRQRPWRITSGVTREAGELHASAMDLPILFGGASLASSPEAASLGWLALESRYGGVLGADAMSHAATALASDKMCILLDLPTKDAISCVELDARLKSAFEHEPVEDGTVHVSENLITEALRSTGRDEVLESLRSFALDAQNPVFAASVMRCLGRVRGAGTRDWRVALIGDALRAENLQIRDAAVQAAETWGDKEAIEVLRAHVNVEGDDWLRVYVEGVINDLGK